MTLRQYLIIMMIATILCWVAWWIVVANVDPFQAGTTGFLFFYTTVFFGLLGFCSMLLFALFRLFHRGQTPMYRHVGKSFHGAVMVSVLLTGLLFLQSKGWVRAWNLLALGALMLIVLLFRISLRRPIQEFVPADDAVEPL